MFRWGIIFLVIALIAAALGFGGLAGTAAGAAKIVFVVGIILFLVSLFMKCIGEDNEGMFVGIHLGRK